MNSTPKIQYLDGEPIHYSVGALIKNKEGKYLLIDRLKEPFGFACPAGHVDEGEDYDTALVREVTEETGLIVTSIKQFGFDDSNIPQEMCSRGVGLHIWDFYEVETSGNLIFKYDEVKSIDWYTPEQIKELHLESVWAFVFKALEII